MDDILLEIKNLSIGFGEDKKLPLAVRNVSLQVRKGEKLAIVGESGSGKSVTALSILRLLPNSAFFKSGEILFPQDNRLKNLLGISSKELRDIRGNKISMIFQEPMTSLNPVKRTGVQIMEAILLHRNLSRSAAREHAIRLLDKVHIAKPENSFDKYPHQLSGGQKQRVMIAMAISCSPVLLIADEPTTALDATVQKAILELLKSLQEESGLSIIFITHDLALVAEFADRVVVMYQGEIVETGLVDQIFSNPGHPYTKALLKCRPLPSSKGKRLPLISDFLQETTDVNIQTPVKDNSNVDIGKDGSILLEVKNLTVEFPLKTSFTGKVTKSFKAVDDVSFSVLRGETLGLVGESGCGKTTLGSTLIRLIEPNSGEINFNGKNLAEIPSERLRKMRKDIQIIFQDPYGSLNPRITVGSAIQEPMTVHHIENTASQRKELVMELLRKVELKPEHFNRYPHEFSGGQRQRICIARALGLSPEFIICDESVSALDVSVQAQILNLLNDLKAQLGFTCIFISHDLSVVYYISNRIMVMNKGRIEETGTADEIFYHPASPYTRNLIASMPRVRSA
ncbi:ABC transporter ATP-binding protein [soil metagenome]